MYVSRGVREHMLYNYLVEGLEMLRMTTRLAIAAAIPCLVIVEPAVAADAEIWERVVSEKLVARIENFSKEARESFTVSPDQRHIAYTIAVHGIFGRKLSVVIDGKEIGRYDNVVGDTLRFSPDGQRFAFGAMRGGKRLVVVDGKDEIAGHDRLAAGSFVFSPDSRRVAYGAGTLDGKWSVIVDGQSGKRHDGVGNYNIRFSPDSGRLAYVAIEDRKWFVVVDGQEGKRHDGILDHSLVFRPGSQTVAYIAKSANKQLAVIDEQHYGPYDRVDEIAFSRDGKRFGFLAFDSGAPVIVIDGKEPARHERIYAGSLAFSPDGRRVAYGAYSKEKSVYIVDGTEGAGYENLGKILFSTDGRRMAYIAVKKGEGNFVIVGGNELGPYVNAGPQMSFSPDGNHLAYAAGTDRRLVFLDGKVGISRLALLGRGEILFDSPDQFHYLALKRDGEIFEFYLVEEKIVRRGER